MVPRTRRPLRSRPMSAADPCADDATRPPAGPSGAAPPSGSPFVKVRVLDGSDERSADPSVEDAIFREIVRLRENGESAALATIIDVQGSAPARQPMKILVRVDGTTLGSVGGGCLEEEVKRRAQQVIEEERPARVSMTLTESDTPGGVLFGGGQVSKAVAHLAARVGFRILVTDDRPEYASRERFPMAAQTLVEFVDVAARGVTIDRSTFVLVMTRTHADDRVILEELWKRRAEPRYLGMIGSGTKARL